LEAMPPHTIARLKITLTEIISDGSYPDFAVTKFKDRFGRVHILNGKLLYFTSDELDKTVPREESIECTLIGEGDEYFLVDLKGFRDEEGEHRFEVDKKLISVLQE